MPLLIYAGLSCFLMFLVVVESVQEGHHLGTVAELAGAEVGCVHTVGDAVLHCPQNCLIVA